MSQLFIAAITIGVQRRYGILLYRRGSVVCRSVTIVTLAKTAEPIKMSFETLSRVGQSYHVLARVYISHAEGQF